MKRAGMPTFQVVLAASLFLSVFNTASAVTQKLPQIKCASEVQKLLDQNLISASWTLQAPSPEGQPYRAPSADFGKWAELVVADNDQPTLYFTRNSSTEKYLFGKDCGATKKDLPGLDFSKNSKAGDFVNDEALAAHMKKKKHGLIYVWSPNMVYSAHYFRRFKAAAKKYKLDFLPLVDPRSNHAEFLSARDAVGSSELQAYLNSVELYMRNMTTHFPSTIIYKNGAFFGPIIIGVVETEELESEIRLRLGLKEARK